ncbi:hypothetical protein C942_00958 [Photobacterium marinum]|uniref:Uncharacterized protein n=1 Tax=Photobacterium marinum TaxID=1056511 RepID=L8JAQ8_9GAMM|nr:hypothetical protein [Photobacterium marinum]ELR65871.1 hypothetical protein C942_00958 [Photobacterium marinum]
MNKNNHLRMPFVSPHSRLAVLNELDKAQQLEDMKAEIRGKTYADGVSDALLWVMGKVPPPGE